MKRPSIDKVVIIAIAIISIWVSSNINWGEGKPHTIIKADGKGYYAHLPALFIFQDMNFGFFFCNAGTQTQCFIFLFPVGCGLNASSVVDV